MNIPPIFVNILDAYSFRCMIDIVLSVQSEMSIIFYPDKIIINEASSNQSKMVKVVILTDEILCYNYDVRDHDGILLPSYEVKQRTYDLYESIKIDGKKEGLMFFVQVNPMDLSNQGIRILRSKSFESVFIVNSINSGTNIDRLEDHYESFYLKKGPNCKMSIADFNSSLKSSKLKKFEMTEIVRSADGSIIIQSQEIGQSRQYASRLGTGIFNQYESAQPVETSSREVINNGWMQLTIDNSCAHTIVVNHETIILMMKISKLSNLGMVKIYLELNHPLVLVTKIGNYGTCILSFSGDNNR